MQAGFRKGVAIQPSGLRRDVAKAVRCLVGATAVASSWRTLPSQPRRRYRSRGVILRTLRLETVLKDLASLSQENAVVWPASAGSVIRSHREQKILDARDPLCSARLRTPTPLDGVGEGFGVASHACAPVTSKATYALVSPARPHELRHNSCRGCRFQRARDHFARERQPSPLDFEEVRLLCGSGCSIHETPSLLGAPVTFQQSVACGAV